MGEKLELDLKKIMKKCVMSRNRADGIEIESCIPHSKHILKGNSLVLASEFDGLFCIDLELLPVLAREFMEISEMYRVEK